MKPHLSLLKASVVLGEYMMVFVGGTSMVVEVSVDGAVVVETAFVAAEGVVVLGEDIRVVVGGHLYGCGSFGFC